MKNSPYGYQEQGVKTRSMKIYAKNVDWKRRMLDRERSRRVVGGASV